MMRRFFSLSLLVLLLLALPTGLQAAVVGKFSQVEGQVDVLKQGKLPAVAAKAQDGVEPGDVVRTKSEARAQIQFVDDTTLTLSPGSRVTIEEYLYDAASGKRLGVIQVLRGMVQAAVSRVLEVEKPDFILKTHTAVMGVRGTKWYAYLSPHATDVYNESGKVGVSNLLPEIVGEVILKQMEFTRVGADLPPTLPSPFSKEDLQMLQHRLTVGVPKVARVTGGPTGQIARGQLGQFASATPLGMFNPRTQPVINFSVPSQETSAAAQVVVQPPGPVVPPPPPPVV